MLWQKRLEQLHQLQGMEKLLEIMAMLRDPEHGCPWDKKQTFNTILPYTLEEAYEVADAIEKNDLNELEKELGDLLFQVVFYAQMADEQNEFNFHQIANTMCAKLIHRHPHVFSDTKFDSEQDINQNWENLKSKERQEKDPQQTSVLDDIPRTIPALSRAYKLQKRASHVGFDWPDVHGAFEKVSEEIEEVKQELKDTQKNKEKIADELGDLYFALTNVTRHLGMKPEDVLRAANNKFERRFRGVEALAAANGSKIEETPLSKLDHYWDEIKKTE